MSEATFSDLRSRLKDLFIYDFNNLLMSTVIRRFFGHLHNTWTCEETRLQDLTVFAVNVVLESVLNVDYNAFNITTLHHENIPI